MLSICSVVWCYIRQGVVCKLAGCGVQVDHDNNEHGTVCNNVIYNVNNVFMCSKLLTFWL